MKLACTLTLLAAMVGLAPVSGTRGPGDAPAQGKPDLVVKNVEIYSFPPKHELPDGVATGRMVLHQYRSYRVIMTIENKSGVKSPPFDVAMTATLTGVGGGVSVKNGGTVELGRARVGDLGRGTIYACFDVFPGSAKAGEHDLRFVVDVVGEVDESDESELSNVWKHKGTFVAPK